MNADAPYTAYHPKWYRRRMSVWWWLQKPAYARFVLRELTSVFVALVAMLYMWQLVALARGPESYAQFLERLSAPPVLALNVVTLLFLLLHSITWFNLTPTAIVLRAGGRRVPDWAIAGANYVAWVLVSAAIVGGAVALGGRS